MKITPRKIAFAAMTLYIACFQWVYVQYLFPTFGYLGFEFYPPSPGYLALAWVLSLFPALWMPVELTRPSQLAYWVLYISVFIPSMFVPLYAQMEPAGEVAVLMLVLFLAFWVVSFSYRLPLWRTRPARVSSRSLWKGLSVLSGFLALWLIVVFWNNLQIVAFADVYDLRNASNDVTGDATDFAFMFLTGAINPLFMAYGLFYRRYRLFFWGAAGQ